MALRTLKIDTATGDLALEAGQVVIIEGVQAVAQAVRMRLQFILGEWYLNQELGIDYFGEVLVAQPNMGRIRELFRREILATRGVARIISLGLSFDRTARHLTITTEILADDGLVALVEAEV